MFHTHHHIIKQYFTISSNHISNNSYQTSYLTHIDTFSVPAWLVLPLLAVVRRAGQSGRGAGGLPAAGLLGTGDIRKGKVCVNVFLSFSLLAPSQF